MQTSPVQNRAHSLVCAVLCGVNGMFGYISDFEAMLCFGVKDLILHLRIFDNCEIICYNIKIKTKTCVSNRKGSHQL